MPLEILHIVAPAAAGGLEQVVGALARGHARAGHRVTVAVMALGQDTRPFISSIDGGSINVATIAVSPRGYREERMAVRRLCQEVAPTVVHTHGYRPDTIDGMPLRALGVPIVSTVHGFTGGGWKNRVYEMLHRRALRRFDAVVAVSRPIGVRLSASGVPAERVHVIPNAYDPSGASPAETLISNIDARAIMGLDDNRLTLGWVGRLSREKGLDVLIDALPLLSDLDPLLVVCGDGPERSALMTQATVLGVAPQIRWCGIIPHARRLFRGFDLFVMSSRSEGTPIALFEAMNAEVPIVTTAVGGIPDVVSPLEASLVPAQNPSALAAAIRDARTNRAAAAARVSAAHARLGAAFSTTPWLAAYETVYRKVAGDHRPRPDQAGTPMVSSTEYAGTHQR